jgi:transposase
LIWEILAMMGSRQEAQGALFYEFSIDDYVPKDHLLRLIDRFVDLADLRKHLAPFYSSTGHPSIDPELMIRMLLVGYTMGIRSERSAGFVTRFISIWPTAGSAVSI